jgi:hypothetical protein
MAEEAQQAGKADRERLRKPGLRIPEQVGHLFRNEVGR